MFNLFKKNRTHPPICELVSKSFGRDEFLFENRKKNRDFATILYSALDVGFTRIENWKKEKACNIFIDNTNHDIIAFEIGIFTMCQALEELKANNMTEDDYYDSEYDEEEIFCYKDILMAIHLMSSMYNHYYGDISDYHQKRFMQYSQDAKTSTELFCSNLISLSGAVKFDEIKAEFTPDLSLQILMSGFGLIHRKLIIPAFLETTKNLLNADFPQYI